MNCRLHKVLLAHKVLIKGLQLDGFKLYKTSNQRNAFSQAKLKVNF